MKIELLKLLVCPKSNQSLHLEDKDNQNHEEDIKTGFLVSEDGTNRYPIINGIPRFVPETNYADNFGINGINSAELNLIAIADNRYLQIDFGWLLIGHQIN